MLRRQINIKQFKRPTKEQYFFSVLFVNLIVHGFLATHIHSETHDAAPYFPWEFGCLLTSLKLHFAVSDLLSETSDSLSETNYLQSEETKSGSGFNQDIKSSIP
jgi:hypothetical protein